MRFRFSGPVLVVLLGSTTFAAEPVREVVTQALVAGPLPGFDHGYLYFVDHPSNYVRIFAPDGHLLSSFDPHPGGRATVSSIAVDPSGVIASAITTAPAQCAVDLRSFDGTPIRSFNTGNYCYLGLAWDDDHSLWSFGAEFTPTGRRLSAEFMTVRRYSPDGQQMAAYLPRSQFPGDAMLTACCLWQPKISVAKDHIGVNAIAGSNGGILEWVELDLKGNITGRWAIPSQGQQGLTPVLTSDGEAYMSRRVPEAKTIRTFKLNRATSTWDLMETLPDGSVWGVDGVGLCRLVDTCHDFTVVYAPLVFSEQLAQNGCGGGIVTRLK